MEMEMEKKEESLRLDGLSVEELRSLLNETQEVLLGVYDDLIEIITAKELPSNSLESKKAGLLMRKANLKGNNRTLLKTKKTN